jgi:hypothetical protein
MKVFGVICGTLAVSLLCPSAWSQQDMLLGADQVATERLRIETQRQQANAELDAQEQACQTRFMVTSCEQGVRRRRIATLSELKRQDGLLNDAERRQRGAEQVQLGDEKRAERALSDADLARSPGPSQVERKMDQDAKVLQHQKTGASAKGTPNEGRTPSTPATPDMQTNRATHLQRLEHARQRRVDRDKRLLERPAGEAGLPVPK